MDVLIKTISDLTGFPEEMLEGDMDLESDLGIDSIKRVEILSTLEKELPQIGTLSSDEIANFKTINEISAYLDKSLGQIATQIPDQEPKQQPIRSKTASDKKKTPKATTDPVIPAQKLLRQIPFLEQHPIDKVKFYNGSRLSISNTKKVYLTNDTSGIAQSFQKEFEKQGINTDLIELSNTEIPELTDAAGIVVIPDISKTSDSSQTTNFLKTAFKLVKKNVPYLTESASQKSAFFATVSFLGGSFGFDKKEIANPGSDVIPFIQSGSIEGASDLPISIILGEKAFAISTAHSAVTPFAPPVITKILSVLGRSSVRSYSVKRGISSVLSFGILHKPLEIPISTDPCVIISVTAFSAFSMISFTEHGMSKALHSIFFHSRLAVFARPASPP